MQLVGSVVSWMAVSCGGCTESAGIKKRVVCQRCCCPGQQGCWTAVPSTIRAWHQGGLSLLLLLLLLPAQGAAAALQRLSCIELLSALPLLHCCHCRENHSRCICVSTESVLFERGVCELTYGSCMGLRGLRGLTMQGLKLTSVRQRCCHSTAWGCTCGVGCSHSCVICSSLLKQYGLHTALNPGCESSRLAPL